MKTFVIAEAGVNHNGNLDLALKLVEAAADAGADAIKFQTFRADALVAKNTGTVAYQSQSTGVTDQHELLRQLELSPDITTRCSGAPTSWASSSCRRRSIPNSADFLAKLGIRRVKVPSGEITNLPFIEQLTRFGLPMILSTGMADLDEVRTAVKTIQDVQGSLKDRPQAPALCVLHCTSAYPTPDADVNLSAIDTLKRALDVPIGYSDHTPGIFVTSVAVAMGACMIEKHITLDRTLPGPDHKASIEPDELTQMIADIRRVEALAGDGEKAARPIELEARQLVRKSLKAARALPAGHVLAAAGHRDPAAGRWPAAWRFQEGGRRAHAHAARGRRAADLGRAGLRLRKLCGGAFRQQLIERAPLVHFQNAAASGVDDCCAAPLGQVPQAAERAVFGVTKLQEIDLVTLEQTRRRHQVLEIRDCSCSCGYRFVRVENATAATAGRARSGIAGGWSGCTRATSMPSSASTRCLPTCPLKAAVRNAVRRVSQDEPDVRRGLPQGRIPVRRRCRGQSLAARSPHMSGLDRANALAAVLAALFLLAGIAARRAPEVATLPAVHRSDDLHPRLGRPVARDRAVVQVRAARALQGAGPRLPAAAGATNCGTASLERSTRHSLFGSNRPEIGDICSALARLDMGRLAFEVADFMARFPEPGLDGGKEGCRVAARSTLVSGTYSAGRLRIGIVPAEQRRQRE